MIPWPLTPNSVPAWQERRKQPRNYANPVQEFIDAFSWSSHPNSDWRTKSIHFYNSYVPFSVVAHLCAELLQMHRRLIGYVATRWKPRVAGGVRYNHDLLEKQLKLRQPHELPAGAARREWNDDPLPWPQKLAFGLLGLGMIGAVAYELDRYWKYQRPGARRVLDTNDFLAFTLSSKEPVSSTCSIFTLQPAKDHKSVSDPYLPLWQSAVWSVQAKQPQLQIARSYTPLPPSQPFVPLDPRSCALRFLIREEDNGEMSGYLHRLGVGATIELRGPMLEGRIPSGLDEIVFFAGGTGIAPALQVAHYLSQQLPGNGKPPRLQIVWSSRRREDCQGGTDDKPKPAKGWNRLFDSSKSARFGSHRPQASPIVQELERLKAAYAGRLRVDYFVDEESQFVDAAAVREYLHSPSGDPPEETQKAIMVAGPEGFVNYLAGAKEWKGGKEQQGELGGLLKGIIQPHWTVLKF